MSSFESEKFVVTAIACHFTDLGSFTKDFQKCTLPSMITQTHAQNAIYVAWSTENLQLYDEVEKILTLCEDLPFLSGIELVFLPHHGRYQQFQHYEQIYKHFAENHSDEVKENAWFLFGDSGDTWHPDRVKTVISHQEHTNSKSIIVFNWSAVQEGDMIWINKNDGAIDEFEYFVAFVKFSIFAEFFQTLVHPQYLTSPWCDLAFDRYLLNRKVADLVNVSFSSIQQPDNWMYLKAPPGSVFAGAAFNIIELVIKFLENQLMENYPQPLRKIVEWKAYGSDVLFALTRPITMDDIINVKQNPSQTMALIKKRCCNPTCVSESERLSDCVACRRTRYCSKECQKTAWKKQGDKDGHKITCKKQDLFHLFK